MKTHYMGDAKRDLVTVQGSQGRALRPFFFPFLLFGTKWAYVFIINQFHMPFACESEKPSGCEDAYASGLTTAFQRIVDSITQLLGEAGVLRR